MLCLLVLDARGNPLIVYRKLHFDKGFLVGSSFSTIKSVAMLLFSVPRNLRVLRVSIWSQLVLDYDHGVRIHSC